MNDTRLPEFLLVLNCAQCGRLMTRKRADAVRFKLYLWGGQIADRPACTNCFLERLAPTSAVEPEKFRGAGQRDKIETLKGLDEPERKKFEDLEEKFAQREDKCSSSTLNPLGSPVHA